jgi:hypothetical protein
MGKERTSTGPYSAQTFDKSGGPDKIRNVDIGPAEGLKNVKNPYSVASYVHLDSSAGLDRPGPVSSSAGRVIRGHRSNEHIAPAVDQGKQDLSDTASPTRLSPGLRFRGISRPAVFGAFGQMLIIGSDIEHLLFGDRIGHVLRHRARFLRKDAPVLWII